MKSIVAITCASLMAALPSLTYAQTTQYYPENTPQACSDRVDNDGDGYVDCYDPDCRYFNFCTPQGQTTSTELQPAPPPAPPPPEQAAPPAQPYYQPQSTTYTPPATSSSSQGNGMGEIIAGSIMLPLGLGLAGGSAPLWIEGFNSFNSSTAQIYWLVGASSMAVVGTILTIIGAVMIPTGVNKHNAWKRRQHRAALPLFDNGKLTLTPEAGAGRHGGNVGLKLTF